MSVAVAANPRGFSTGWHASYDYEALGKIADHLFIMAYDEHYQGSAAGPVASLSFVEQSIQYARKYVAGNKIVLGIPFYGRIWSGDGSVKGLGIPLNTLEEYRKTYRGTVRMDQASGSPVMTFTITASDPKPTLYGKTLSAGTYTAWFENADSIKGKLALVNKYGLKGAGNWSAGQETADVWDYYGLWLGGKYFSDIQEHFAKDAIVRVTAEGILKGVDASRFQPNGALTRAQAAAIAVRTLDLEGAAGNAPFSDVRDHWAAREISLAAQAGILKGYGDGTFRPDKPVTRAEMSVLLSRMLEASYARGANSFWDVDNSHWAVQEITALAQADILRGYGDGSFRPEKLVSRGETAALIDRVLELLD